MQPLLVQSVPWDQAEGSLQLRACPAFLIAPSEQNTRSINPSAGSASGEPDTRQEECCAGTGLEQVKSEAGKQGSLLCDSKV